MQCFSVFELDGAGLLIVSDVIRLIAAAILTYSLLMHLCLVCVSCYECTLSVPLFCHTDLIGYTVNVSYCCSTWKQVTTQHLQLLIDVVGYVIFIIKNKNPIT